jgi:hypothetical protein
MTDDQPKGPEAEPAPENAGSSAPPGGTAFAESGGYEEPSARGREWLAQLQEMIDRVAAEAGPVARDVAAKAAELAAVAGDKAGPFARRAADVTGDVGTKVAERSRRFADDMRHRGAESGAPPADAAAFGVPADAAPAEAPAPEAPQAEDAPPA